MQDMFPGYFKMSDQDIANICKNGLFVLDTNVLLNFYRYSPYTSTDFLSLFQQLAPRLWVPNRVMEEFYRNRKRVILSQDRIYDEIKKIFERTKDNLGALLVRGHLSINLDVLKNVGDALDDIWQHVEQDKSNHPNLLVNDTIRQSIEQVLTDRVGDAYDAKKLAEIYTQADQRYIAKIPPGYKDTETKKSIIGDQKYGDLLVWFQTIDKAKSSKKDIIFVTDEKKEDWWWIDEDGEIMGPRPELVREISKLAHVKFYMCSPATLLDLAAKYLNITVKPNTANEVQEVEDISIGWKDEITSAFKSLGGQATWSDLYEYIQEHTSRKMPNNWRAVIRYTVFAHSSDSEAYRSGEDLYTHVSRGKWGLRMAVE